MQELPLIAQASPWPLFDDAILVGTSGLSRSGRLGITLNLSAVLLDEACRYSSGACDQNVDVAFADARTVLTAAVITWSKFALSNGTAPHATEAAAFDAPFSLTLVGASCVVLRSESWRPAPAF
jgi:hypothetical protein